MNASQFQEILNKESAIGKTEILQLKKIQENFPYFNIPHILSSRYEYQKGGEAGFNLGMAAINSPDRIYLKKLIEMPLSDKVEEKSVDFLPEETPQKSDAASRTQSLLKLGENLKSQPEKSTSPSPKPKKRTRRPGAGEDLIETIKKKEKKEILDDKKKEQIDLIKAFSKKEIKLATIKEIEANQNTENLAESSTQINDNIVSESLAKIFAKQGKTQKAIEIYKKLSLKFPDKRAYFADLIEKLNKS